MEAEETLPETVDQRYVADHYSISISTQEKMRREDAFAPWYRVGRKVYYIRTEFEEWLTERQAARHQKAAERLAAERQAMAEARVTRATELHALLDRIGVPAGGEASD